MKTKTHFWSHLSHLLLEWETFDTKIVDIIKTHIMFNYFNLKSYLLWENVGKYYRAGQATDDNMTQAHCMLGNT